MFAVAVFRGFQAKIPLHRNSDVANVCHFAPFSQCHVIVNSFPGGSQGLFTGL